MSNDDSLKDFLAICHERKLVHQVSDTDGLTSCMRDNPDCTAYIGFDATAPALHVGNLLQIIMLRWWQFCGHTPIVLVGGGTTMIGDPSGKDRQRNMMSTDQIDRNAEKFGQDISNLFSEPERVIFANNATWLRDLKYIDVLREIGAHFSMSRMLSFDSVRLRMERQQNLSFLEFNYMILQAYDFLSLARRHGCHLQMGGSDQWGNIVSGIELNRRIDGRNVYGLTTPLLTTSQGAKMGKTENGAVWLDSSMMPVFDFWQFWRNTDDRDVGRFLRMYTDFPLDEISRYDVLEGDECNAGKIVLANSVTSLVHGTKAARAAERGAKGVFGPTSRDNDDALPTFNQHVHEKSGKIQLTDLLCAAGLCTSQSAARRLIAGRGVRLDGAIIDDIAASVSWQQGQSQRLSVGKKRHVRVLWTYN